MRQVPPTLFSELNPKWLAGARAGVARSVRLVRVEDGMLLVQA